MNYANIIKFILFRICKLGMYYSYSATESNNPNDTYVHKVIKQFLSQVQFHFDKCNN